MARSQKNLWRQHDLNRVGFGPSADTEQTLKELQQQQQMANEFNSNPSLSQPPFFSDSYRLASDNMLLPIEGDQVVPSSQRQAVFGVDQREAKPLPPLPDPEELMSDEAADSEVEFFTSDRRPLLPKSCPKPICRNSSKDFGQVNYAYQESSLRAGDAGIGSMAFSWPSREDRPTFGGGRFAANIWCLGHQRDENQPVVSEAEDTFGAKRPDQHLLPRIQFSGSVPSTQPQGSTSSWSTDRPQIPPRIPIPPKSKTGTDEDKPPKIPPRMPLVPPCPPRTPSPKSLPIYINGVMPATQSFAANPKYVSKALLRQMTGEPPATQFSPCIVPILKDGRKASGTHYILLPPGRPPNTERRERLLSEPAKTGNSSFWQKR